MVRNVSAHKAAIAGPLIHNQRAGWSTINSCWRRHRPLNTMSNMIEQIPIVSKVIGMIAAFIKYFTDFFQTKRKLDRDHDITVFRKLDSVANESRLDDILNSRIANSRLRMEDHYALADLIDALNRIENAFLNNTLKSRASELVKGLDQLLICVMATHFKTRWLERSMKSTESPLHFQLGCRGYLSFP